MMIFTKVYPIYFKGESSEIPKKTELKDKVRY